VFESECIESYVNEPWADGKSPVTLLYWPNLKRGQAVRYFYEVSDLLYSFAVFAVIPLLLAAVFRCYFTAASFEKPEFLPPSEILPLYFPGFISGISGRGHRRSKVGAQRFALRGCRKNTLHQGMCVLRDAARLRRVAPQHDVCC
jgi:hypothetical protein